jgi:hypothetical protein
MAVFGFGASYGGTNDVSGKFIKQGIACVGWQPKEAPPLHTILKHIKTGDIIYLKSQPPSIGLIIKAVGIVTGHKVKKYSEGFGIRVRWIWIGEKRLQQIRDGCRPVRNLTLFEEYNFDVQSVVIKLLLTELNKL